MDGRFQSILFLLGGNIIINWIIILIMLTGCVTKPVKERVIDESEFITEFIDMEEGCVVTYSRNYIYKKTFNKSCFEVFNEM